MLNQDEPFLTPLLEKEEEKYIYNNVAYQNKDSKVNTCGSHVVHRIYRLKNDDVSLLSVHEVHKRPKPM